MTVCYSTVLSSVRRIVTTFGDVGTGSVPVTLCGGGGGGVDAARAMVPVSELSTTARTNRRVNELCIGKSPFQREVRCAETRNLGRRNRCSRQSCRPSDTEEGDELCSWSQSQLLPMSFASTHYRQEVDGLRVTGNTKSAIFELIGVADLRTLRRSAETYAT